MKIPAASQTIEKMIDDYVVSQSEPPRPHLGCSQLGHPCDRYLWLSFRWAVMPHFSGRLLRLFHRGQREEESILHYLRAIGLKIDEGEQQRVDFGSHVSGSIDAVIRSGVPEAPQKTHIGEFKTHNKKSFDALLKEGVEKSKFPHYVQMQLYMLGTNIDRALYVAVCKDDDRIYTARVRFDEILAKKYRDRGIRIALSDRIPEPISADPAWHQCKWCEAHDFCFGSQRTKEVNCRTCAHVTAKPDSSWRCERHQADGIPVKFQRKGCDCHTIHPDLVPWELITGGDQWTAIYAIAGVEVATGEPDAYIFSSQELLNDPQKCAAIRKGNQ